MAVEVILPARRHGHGHRQDQPSGMSKDGDKVTKGAALFEIETDKAAMEIDAPADGILRNIIVGEGGTAAVGSAVAYHLCGGRSRRRANRRSQPAEAQHRQPRRSCARCCHAACSRRNGEAPRATPLARRLARQAGLSLDGDHRHRPARPHRGG